MTRHGEAAAAHFRGAIEREQWRKKISHILDPLGKLKSRKLISKTYETVLPASPDGEYLVMKFSTTYDNKESSIETVTSMLDKDNVWRVSGYYIK